VNSRYGFKTECCRKLTEATYKKFNETFSYFSLAATVDSKFFCVHGGISPELLTLEDIKRVKKPFEVPRNGLVCDLLWSDPDKNVSMLGKSKRKISVTFGRESVRKFLEANKLQLIIRAHQCVPKGFKFCLKQQVLTVFSAPEYSGKSNKAAEAIIGQNSVLRIHTFGINGGSLDGVGVVSDLEGKTQLGGHNSGLDVNNNLDVKKELNEGSPDSDDETVEPPAKRAKMQ